MEENNNEVVNSENVENMNDGENKIVLEFSSVKNGVETKQTQINDEIKPKEEKKKNNVIPVIGLIVLLAVVISVVFIIVFASKESEAKKGTIKNSQMIYENPIAGQVIDFNITNELTIEMSIKKIEDNDDVKVVTYDLNVKGHKDKISNCTAWLDNGKLYVSFKSVGNSFVYISDEKDVHNGMIVNVLNKDGKLYILNNFDDDLGLVITNVKTKEDSLLLDISRLDITGEYVRFGDKKEDDSETVGLSICKEKIQDIDKEEMVSAYVLYTLVDNQLDIDNPQYDSITSLGNYLTIEKIELCQ